MSFELAYAALTAEADYVEGTGTAVASVTGSIVDVPGQVPQWGAWGDIGAVITECFATMDHKVGTAEPNMKTVSEALLQTLAAYRLTEAANTVR